MELEEIVNNGIVFYMGENGKYFVEKKSSINNNLKINLVEFEDFKTARNYIDSILNKTNEWQAIVRFNRGLGIEYKNIQNIIAESKEQAKEMARLQAEKTIGDSIIEIRVVPVLRTK